MGQSNSMCRSQCSQADFTGELLETGPPLVIAAPGLAKMGQDLAEKTGSEDIASVDWDSFPSGDPNIRFRWQDVQGQHVVFLFDTVDRSRLFEQLALLQQLQGFPLPDADDSPRKWKTYAQEGRYAWGRAHRITVVIPWYRPCQMERTSRWEAPEGVWTNSVPEGRWLDIPFAQSLAALLSAPAPQPPGKGPALALDSRPLVPLWRPPVTLFFVELHEEDPVKSAIAPNSSVSVRTERFVPFFLTKFLERQRSINLSQLFVLFPDHGAYERYFNSVKECLGLENENILYINKTRVGDKIKQEQKLFYQSSLGATSERAIFKRGQHVLIIDDFTNSGGTLFGAVALVRSLLKGEFGQALSEQEQAEGLPVSIFVSHLVAAYKEETVKKIRQKLTDLGPQCRFYTTDSIPTTTNLLLDEPQAEVLPIADFLMEYVR
ncbi:Ribose-phosphate pyrophosphokinase 3 [Durusdinium trenchii]|uniref:Chloroplastic (Phosphoribosyl pyrophosphate synthase 3) n=1 Tax=Durusdinium trenchii TaxID=1381693 RepID=A0ABP0I965_9DINO